MANLGPIVKRLSNSQKKRIRSILDAYADHYGRDGGSVIDLEERNTALEKINLVINEVDPASFGPLQTALRNVLMLIEKDVHHFLHVNQLYDHKNDTEFMHSKEYLGLNRAPVMGFLMSTASEREHKVKKAFYAYKSAKHSLSLHQLIPGEAKALNSKGEMLIDYKKRLASYLDKLMYNRSIDSEEDILDSTNGLKVGTFLIAVQRKTGNIAKFIDMEYSSKVIRVLDSELSNHLTKTEYTITDKEKAKICPIRFRLRHLEPSEDILRNFRDASRKSQRDHGQSIPPVHHDTSRELQLRDFLSAEISDTTFIQKHGFNKKGFEEVLGSQFLQPQNIIAIEKYIITTNPIAIAVISNLADKALSRHPNLLIITPICHFFDTSEAASNKHRDAHIDERQHTAINYDHMRSDDLLFHIVTWVEFEDHIFVARFHNENPTDFKRWMQRHPEWFAFDETTKRIRIIKQELIDSYMHNFSDRIKQEPSGVYTRTMAPDLWSMRLHSTEAMAQSGNTRSQQKLEKLRKKIQFVINAHLYELINAANTHAHFKSEKDLRSEAFELNTKATRSNINEAEWLMQVSLSELSQHSEYNRLNARHKLAVQVKVMQTVVDSSDILDIAHQAEEATPIISPAHTLLIQKKPPSDAYVPPSQKVAQFLKHYKIDLKKYAMDAYAQLTKRNGNTTALERFVTESTAKTEEHVRRLNARLEENILNELRSAAMKQFMLFDDTKQQINLNRESYTQYNTYLLSLYKSYQLWSDMVQAFIQHNNGAGVGWKDDEGVSTNLGAENSARTPIHTPSGPALLWPRRGDASELSSGHPIEVLSSPRIFENTEESDRQVHVTDMLEPSTRHLSRPQNASPHDSLGRVDRMVQNDERENAMSARFAGKPTTPYVRGKSWTPTLDTILDVSSTSHTVTELEASSHLSPPSVRIPNDDAILGHWQSTSKVYINTIERNWQAFSATDLNRAIDWAKTYLSDIASTKNINSETRTLYDRCNSLIQSIEGRRLFSKPSSLVRMTDEQFHLLICWATCVTFVENRALPQRLMT